MRKVALITIIALVLAALAGNVFAQRLFYGNVEKMPEKGYVGTWVVDGKTIFVVPDTKMDLDHGKPKVGSYVKVKGVEFEGKFVAYEVETKILKQ
jgi:hypothetical protein